MWSLKHYVRDVRTRAENDEGRITTMRNLIRWEPTSDLYSVADRMDRLFDEMMGRGVRRSLEDRPLRGAWVPAVNIVENAEAIEISADLPGLRAEDVELTVDNGVLTLRGERRLAEQREGETWHRVERIYGAFERTFTLPSTVDVGKIEARFANGEMTVRLPKREESKPRSVKINVASA